MKDKETEIKRILLCRLGGIGDVIHTLPLVKYLRKKHTTASIEYITSSDVAELIKDHCPYVDRTWVFDKKNKHKVAKNLLNNSVNVDYFFNLHSSLSFFFFNLFYIKAKKFFQYKKDISVHAVVNFAKTYDESLSALNLDMKTVLVDNVEEILDRYSLSATKYICLVPGVGNIRAHRGWPFENWLSLAKKILNYEKDYKIVFLGGKYEQKVFENWINLAKESEAYKNEDSNSESLPGFKNRAINLTGKLSLSEVARIISKSNYLISCDTGLLHLAAALSVKVIGLYGPTLPKRSGPFTGNYQVISAKNCECISNFLEVKNCKKSKEPSGYCMNTLTVNEILSAVSQNLVEAR
ncbi:MAG: glycosyltransferase family 9 protein [Candidatus Melainabacteria bacterium]|nr:glycosyltransferase family 9 protein [Candidatus Melainabacteria bacterium]